MLPVIASAESPDVDDDWQWAQRQTNQRTQARAARYGAKPAPNPIKTATLLKKLRARGLKITPNQESEVIQAAMESGLLEASGSSQGISGVHAEQFRKQLSLLGANDIARMVTTDILKSQRRCSRGFFFKACARH